MMSMLSAQCDELRAMAESVGLAMPQAATLMMEAADTILSLRDRAQVLQAENAKLQASNEVIAEDHAALCEHNAKLRELVRDYDHCTMHADCSRCEHDGKLSIHCPLSPCFPDSDELRELGVEI